MTAEPIRVSTRWLDLREPVDADARSAELVDRLRGRLSGKGRLVIHDLACGTGSMGRWLAPLLPGPQHWVLHDRDADLLDVAAAELPGPATDGAPVTAETRLSDVTRLDSGDLAGASLITASALLDLLTQDELGALADACITTGCPVLLAMSVTGRVRLAPVDPLDVRIGAAFDDHQRRMTVRGRLLGPDAARAAAERFRRTGAEVVVSPSPWRLGPTDAALAAEWFAGWLGAAYEQDAGLAAAADAYGCRRLAEARAGELAATVDHIDLLVLP